MKQIKKLELNYTPGEIQVPVIRAIKQRTCTICKRALPEGRRFMHEECQSLASDGYYDIYADYEFHV